MDRLCFLVTISPPSEPQGNFMDNVYRGIIRVQEFYGQCVRYCRTFPMHVMAGIDLVLLLGALAIVVQARYHLYANIVVELTMYNFFSVAVSPGPQDMYFNLQTFYETFSNVQVGLAWLCNARRARRLMHSAASAARRCPLVHALVSLLMIGVALALRFVP
jgi:hypothetical protein